ncbi:hypothetical protein ASG54_14780 [Aureimonas sp. Leaf460]|nr:hypothetical protein ASG62_01440 [Aureimonas sp. Leaf427]KQT76045.1 hypothetical protein ASG54_14780 [Aureimonas sp. Leaf460]
MPSPSPLFDPVYLAGAIWRSRGLVLLFGLLGLLGALAVALTTPKVYEATTQILIDPRDIKVVANEVTPNGLPSEATLALIESQTSVILSNNVLSRVAAKAGLESDPEFNGQLKTGIASLLPSVFTSILSNPDAALRERELRVIDRLRHALTVARETKSFVINLTVASIDPQKAAEIANITAEVFIAEQGRVQSDTARRATDSLSSRLSELRRSVVEAEGRVEDYKSRNALIGVGGRLVDDDYIVRINDQLAKARGDITGLRVRADSMRRASVEDVVRGTLPEELASAALVRLRQSYSDLAQQAAILATKLGPRHPQRIATEGALGAARQAIAGELGRIVAAAQTELARATETERNLTAQIEELKAKQVETSGSFVKLRELEREVDASRAVYEAFLLRARETSEQESLNTANVRVISDATTPFEASGMSKKIVLLAGLVMGLAAGIALATVLAVLKVLTGAATAAPRRDLAAAAPAPSGPLETPETAPSAPDRRLEPAVMEGVSELDRASRLPRIVAEPDVASPPNEVAVPVEVEARAIEASVREPAEPASSPAPLGSEAAREGQLLRRAPAEIFEEPAPAPARAVPPVESGEAEDRAKLRERVRALSQMGAGSAPARAPKAEAAELAHDIASIRETIAEIRRRKATSGRLG